MALIKLGRTFMIDGKLCRKRGKCMSEGLVWLFTESKLGESWCWK